MEGLKNKNILLGVTGGISAYKALELTRLLIKAGAVVRPVMTRSAAEFITPLSFSTLARSKVFTELFDVKDGFDIDHISLAQECDIIVVAPATANIIAKAATGIADDLLSTVIAAATVPLLFAPAMNSAMWNNPVLQSNIEKLKGHGANFVEPATGELACGYEGKGKLAEVGTIFASIEELLERGNREVKDLTGETVLVTAGATREPIDPVRYITNRSSGRMGYAIAGAAKKRGATVILVSGQTDIAAPEGVLLVKVTTAAEMLRACMEHFSKSTILVMAAAVADYRPVNFSDEKIKKSSGALLTLKMKETTDILKFLAKVRTGQFMVGFALETANMVQSALGKLKSKGLDMVVANSSAGIDSTLNEVTLLDSFGGVKKLEKMKKEFVAQEILSRILTLKSSPTPAQV